uniref:glycogenin glucosyltransferase n=1 Tax=Monopterus albus TaxID=43700 RepID=A0A3Q3IZA4_MONAL
MKSLECKATFVSTLVASSSPGYGVASTSSSVMADQAFVTLVTNDSYARGAMVLGMSLRNHKTSKKLVILVTQVSEPYLSVLRRIYDEVRVVDTLDSGDTAHLAMMKRPELGVTLTKLHCWTLTHYSKCVFMDADTMVLSNIDELFDREELSAAPDPGWPDCFNSGVFVYRPSLKTYGKLLQYCTEHGSFDGGDQGILNGFFSSWATADISKHLPFIYNLSSIAIYTYLPAFKQYGSNAKVVHFLGKTKPWSYTYDPKAKQIRGSVHEATAHPTFLQDWWTLYSSAVMPMLQKQQGDKPFQPFFGCMEVKGKAVFITGCDSGFGNALAKHMHKMGFTVFAGCLLKDKGGKGAKELEEFHSDRMKVVQLDVCSEEQVNQAVEYIKDNLEDSERGLWAVVNNAGMSTFGEVEFTSIDTYKQVSEVNLWGVIRVTKAVLPLIRRAKGKPL